MKIKTSSHADQRKLHKNLHGDGWCVETAPFMKKIDRKKYKVVDVPWAYVMDLKDFVMKRLEQLKKYNYFYKMLDL